MALHTIICAICREPFEAVRSDAETCSYVCRNRRHRAAVRERAARHAAEIAATTALLQSIAGLKAAE